MNRNKNFNSSRENEIENNSNFKNGNLLNLQDKNQENIMDVYDWKEDKRVNKNVNFFPEVEVLEEKNINQKKSLNTAEKIPNDLMDVIENEEINDSLDQIEVSYNEKDYEKIYDNKKAVTKILSLELMNFIEVFIHSILYLRNVYPKEAFQNYILYNLNIKYVNHPIICEYIDEFLKNIQALMFNNILDKIKIQIIDPDKKIILEYFTVKLEINEFYHDLNYQDLCLHLKSLLYKFYFEYANKKELNPDCNKSFLLCIETKNSKIFTSSNFKTFKEISKNLEDNFIIQFYNNTPIKMLNNIEKFFELNHVNMNIEITRNCI